MTKKTNAELQKDLDDLRNELKDYMKAQRTRDTSIFLALLSAVISAAVKYMFAV